MVNKIVRKKLLEQKTNKERLLVENKIVTNRLKLLFESVGDVQNIQKLTEAEKEKLAIAFFSEVSRLNNMNLINEQFLDIMKNIFGNAFSGLAQSLIEPLINSLLGGLGLTGFFKDFLVSFFTRNPQKIFSAFKSCRDLTEVVASALSEGMIMMVQKEAGLSGFGYDAIRNTLVDSMGDNKFLQSLSDSLETFVCDLYNKFTGKAEEVYDKLKPETTSTQKSSVTPAT